MYLQGSMNGKNKKKERKVEKEAVVKIKEIKK